ncbi:MAG: ribose 5-phosphate isomerase B [Planctomycetaceae bacterium]|nr:ribose 5-phosphate isomerase B [Planctomycetaceae bacterium]HAA70503.1 ribose 5-phosphate isomerase B [Planctomycetaceae bacterium]|tara:strand:- start:9179 stop:9616 length:438 start_codon:yes stop_codon:yes gene_type:complete
MRIAIGSDHRGWQVKARLVKMLQDAGHEMFDLGTNSADSVDYPDIASAVSSRVSAGDVERGILICGTGIGMSISANKFSGVRAATCQDAFVAEMSRRHNDVNVLCLGGDLLGERLVDDLVGIWLKTEFEGGRHGRRIDKIGQLER